MSEFATKKWIEVNDLSDGQNSANNGIRFKTTTPRSDLCDYSDAHIVVKERISVTDINAANRKNKKLTFKNNAWVRSYIPKINNTFIDNVEDLDTAMPMYNLLECSDNYSLISGSLWNYYRDEVNDAANENNANCNYRINNNQTTTRKYFEHKTKITESTPVDNNALDAEVVVPWK